MMRGAEKKGVCQARAILRLCLAGSLALASWAAQAQEPFLPGRGEERLPGRREERPGPFRPDGPIPNVDERFLPKLEERGLIPRPSARLWCALVLAYNSDKAKPLAPELAHAAKQVEQVFGYKQMEIIGSATKPVDDLAERSLVPSQDFSLNVRPKRYAAGIYDLDVQIFHLRRRIIVTEAKLGVDSPMVIRGPQCSRGQLLIILQILP
jgi:hypothetical protein